MNPPESILAIHQEPKMLQAWTEIVRHKWGARLSSCADFDEAEQTLRTTPFDLIICPHQTEVESGLDFLKRLRVQGIITPAVLVSAALDSRTIIGTFQLPGAEFLQTPFSLADLDQAWHALADV